jgi:aspartate/methionine/tyrosine aminotransferase
MIVLNNPNNPLGTILSLQAQQDVVALAREKDMVLLVDEIFRPLFHGDIHPPSFAELAGPDDKIVITSSLSKSWGLIGTRVGWLATQNKQIFDKCSHLVFYTFAGVGALEQVIATEALSKRCRHNILSKHLNLARKNLAVLDKFIADHPGQYSCIRPDAGATVFLRLYSNGAPVDDVLFCTKLKDETGVLLAPGSLCFGVGSGYRQDFRGFVRIHLTGEPEKLEMGLEAVHKALEHF